MATISDIFVVTTIVFSCFEITAYGALFSSLHQTLILNSSTSQGQVLQAGEEQVTITWSLNKNYPTGTDSNYKIVKVKLCYAPMSQLDRGWRKSNDNLNKDKTCQFNVVTKPYKPSNNNFTWTIEKDVPSASYFIRAYVYDYVGEVVAFGQTTDSHKKTNLFQITAITGRHVAINVCAACFSAFSVISLIGFYLVEKRKGKSLRR
ncbi:putative manganese-dependent ADP-ribose/CDP-alcohol diphosphatase-like [Capsicum annuum]|uniref:high-affinity nitrate transporter 3.1 n=1 Tax=Capsicum annuum TaxID=4072 RepID=UPI001FB130D6|nr:high-affinity nitrate transporter 3.1 [Capsicum annuum]KAF3624490.1 putative manganese-dependent ADP-ribose/CDP-alcohol diphosphatase-like [Capsicum annuum]KAF3684773.1 putative manganese-dependent ADP-ribose/CDP-alcohol diphosphatase-like [Capsicum annuum]